VGWTTTEWDQQSYSELSKRDGRRGTFPMSSPLFWARTCTGKKTCGCESISICSSRRSIVFKIVLVYTSRNVWIRSRSVKGRTGRPLIRRYGLSFRIYRRVVNWGGHTAVRLAYRIVLGYVLSEYFQNKTALERQSAWVIFLLAGWKPAIKGNSVGPATWSFIRSPRGRLQGPGSAEEDAGSFGTRTA